VQNIDLSKIDLIVQKTTQLEPEAIIDFISALVQVSSEELKDQENPRKFSL
jgi:16S rRNA U1498 N3-methylase RsmE